MSKGNPIVKTRVSADMLAEMEERVASHNAHAKDLWTVSDFIRDCIRERLSKRARRRAGKSKGE
jgi:Arc/MetJ-type ribon-helix-helix transcriptional regulator